MALFIKTYMNVLLIFIGSGIGGVLRYFISQLIKRDDSQFPLATLITNFSACLFIGIVIQLASSKTSLNITPSQKIFLASGFCGGFSTFSTFALENINMLNQGAVITAITYTILSVILCCGATYIGMLISQQ
jgi:CrcB protein